MTQRASQHIRKPEVHVIGVCRHVGGGAARQCAAVPGRAASSLRTVGPHQIPPHHWRRHQVHVPHADHILAQHQLHDAASLARHAVAAGIRQAKHT